MSYISTADLAALSSPISAYTTTSTTRNVSLPNGSGTVGPVLEMVLILATSLFGSLVLWTALAGAWIH